MDRDELSRDAFLRLAVAELRRQGVAAVSQADKKKPMVKPRTSAEDTFEALHFDMPLISGAGARNLARAMQTQLNITDADVTFTLSSILIRVRLTPR